MGTGPSLPCLYELSLVPGHPKTLESQNHTPFEKIYFTVPKSQSVSLSHQVTTRWKKLLMLCVSYQMLKELCVDRKTPESGVSSLPRL